jgi:hypothetical protein
METKQDGAADEVAFEHDPTDTEVDATRGRGESAMRRVARASEDEVQRAADGEPTDLPVGDALEYLLGAFQDPEGARVTRSLRVNVGTPNNPKLIRWVVRNIPGRRIREVREQAEERARRTKGSSGSQAVFDGNLRVCVEGTVEPNLREGADRLGLADPADFLEVALQSKQGLVEQIAGAILTLSGYDDDDVNDELEVKAAGN